MDLLSLLLGLFALVVFTLPAYVAMTWIGWLIGFLTYSPYKPPRPSPTIKTRGRRWLSWAIACTVSTALFAAAVTLAPRPISILPAIASVGAWLLGMRYAYVIGFFVRYKRAAKNPLHVVTPYAPQAYQPHAQWPTTPPPAYPTARPDLVEPTSIITPGHSPWPPATNFPATSGYHHQWPSTNDYPLAELRDD